MRQKTTLALSMLLFAATPALLAQQTYVPRYDLYGGYAFLDSPQVSLFENGFHFQAGFRPRTWYSVGFDYSVSAGDLTLTPNLLPQHLQQQLSAQLAALAAQGLVPPGYELKVDAHSRTQTFTIGPQLAYRHFKNFTLFLRPSIGAIYEVATPKIPANDPIAAGIIKAFETPAPAGLGLVPPDGKKKDWTIFYGFGGGIDLLITKHFAWRIQADLVRDHLFNDLLANPRGTVRFSTGPAFNLGPNIAHP